MENLDIFRGELVLHAGQCTSVILIHSIDALNAGVYIKGAQLSFHAMCAQLIGPPIYYEN